MIDRPDGLPLSTLRACWPGEPLLPGLGRSGLRGTQRAGDEAAAPVALPEAQGEGGGVRALPARAPRAGHGTHVPEGASQLCVGESVVSNKSPVRKIHTLGSTSGERKRGQGGDCGTSTMVKAAGNRYPLHPRQARLASTWVKSSSCPVLGQLCCTAPPKTVKSLKLIASSRAVSVSTRVLLSRYRDVTGAVALDR